VHSSSPLVAYLFHFQRRHVERNCLESKCVSFSLFLTLSLSSPFCLSLSSSRTLLYQPPSSSSSIYLSILVCCVSYRFRNVASRQYIFQVLMGWRHMLVLTLIARSILAFSFSPLFFPIYRASKTSLVGPLSVLPILPSKRTFPRLSREDITSIKYSEARRTWMRTHHLLGGMTTGICEVSSRGTRKIMVFNYFFFTMSLTI